MNTSETIQPTQNPTRTATHSGKPAQNSAVTSIGLGIPITAICLGTTGGGTSGIVAMLIAWGGIAAGVREPEVLGRSVRDGDACAG